MLSNIYGKGVVATEAQLHTTGEMQALGDIAGDDPSAAWIAQQAGSSRGGKGNIFKRHR